MKPTDKQKEKIGTINRTDRKTSTAVVGCYVKYHAYRVSGYHRTGGGCEKRRYQEQNDLIQFSRRYRCCCTHRSVVARTGVREKDMKLCTKKKLEKKHTRSGHCGSNANLWSTPRE